MPIVNNHATKEKLIPRTAKTPSESEASNRPYRTMANSVAAYSATYATNSEIPVDRPRLSIAGLVRTLDDMMPF